MSLDTQVKTAVRELLPKHYQVPVKYFLNKLQGHLEDEMNLLELLVHRQNLVIDVGGNRGNYAYRLWKLGAAVEIFEPNPACASVLSAWAAGKPRARVHQVALSNVSGKANLHIPVDHSGIEHDSSASIEHNNFSNAREHQVDLRTLDSYDFQDVQLIKIDVEGHEYSVIEGATETIRTSCPALLIEIEQRHTSRPIEDVFERVRRLGYSIHFLGSDGLTPFVKFDAVRDQAIGNFGNEKRLYINNFLFLHQTRLAAGEYQEILKNQGGQ